MSVKKIEIVYLNRKNFTEVDIYFESKLYFGAGEGIRILDPLNQCFIGYQKLKNLIAT